MVLSICDLLLITLKYYDFKNFLSVRSYGIDARVEQLFHDLCVVWSFEKYE